MGQTRFPKWAAALMLACTAASAACSAPSDAVEDEVSDDELQSETARSRDLEFEGVVYLAKDPSDAAILRAVREQTQTAFGSLLNAQIAVNSRELKEVDPKSFRKRNVTAIDTAVAGDSGRTLTEVRYTYKDHAVVPIALSRRSALSLAVLNVGYASQSDRALKECTKNDEETRHDVADGFLWYAFDPSRASCKKAMTSEQKGIDADRKKLTDPKKQVTASEVGRLYLPTTMSLGADKTNKGTTYPEYDRLFSGGVEKDHLVIGFIAGRLAHGYEEAPDDGGYYEWLTTLYVLFAEHPGFHLTNIEPMEDLSTSTVQGHRIGNLKFNDVINWTLDNKGWPEGLDAAGKKQLALQMGKKLDQHWLTFDLDTMVSIAGAAPKKFTISLRTYFGAEEDETPHRRAMKGSDVFVYNGHSYIGYGPLDPSNFSAGDLPESYQMLFFDSCVSYNYYEKDFFAMKAGGTKNLDILTNGLEAPEYLSGWAEGRFLSELITGKASYKTLLKAAIDTDSLRVVDGEVDNRYAPSKKPIRIEELAAKP